MCRLELPELHLLEACYLGESEVAKCLQVLKILGQCFNAKAFFCQYDSAGKSFGVLSCRLEEEGPLHTVSCY